MSLKDSLLLEHQREVQELNINEFTDLLDSLADKAVNAMTSPKRDTTCSYFLDRMGEKVNELKVIDTTELQKLFKYLYNSPIINNPRYRQTIKDIDYNAVETIRPDYLSVIVEDAQKTVAKILAGTKSEKDIRDDLRNMKYEKKLKKQLVKSTIAVSNVKELFSYHDNELVKFIPIDNLTIDNKIYPFLSGYKKEVDNLGLIILKTKSNISNLDNEFANIDKALQKTINDSNTSEKTRKLAKYYWFNMKLIRANLYTYVTTMIIEKVEAYSYMINILAKYYEYISNVLNQQGVVLTESLHEDWQSNIDRDTILQCIDDGNLNIIHRYIENTVHYIQSESGISNKNAYTCDNVLYDGIVASFATIVSNLHKFETGITQPDFIMDELIDECEMNQNPLSRFSKLIESTKVVPSEIFTVEDGVAEILAFENNVERIMTVMHKAVMYADALILDYSSNTYQLSDPDYELVVAQLKKVKEGITDYSYNMVCALIDRFHQLRTKTCNERHICKDRAQYTRDEYFSRNTFVDMEATDYIAESMLNDYETNEIINEYVLTSMMMECKKLDTMKRRGTLPVFEAEEPVANTNTDNNGKETAPASPSVTVSTDANTQHKDNATTVTDAQKAEESKTLTEKFKEFIEKILEKFRGKAADLTKHNEDFLKNSKVAIQNLDMTNTYITMAPYQKVNVDDIVANINTTINKINGLSTDNIPAELRQGGPKAQTFLFPVIPETAEGDAAKTDKFNNFSGRVKTFYMFGSVKKFDLVKYSGDDAKQKVAEMTEYCENYSNIYPKINNACEELRDAAFKKQVDINMVKKDTDKEQKSNEISGNVITSTVKDYIAAVLTVFEKRYVDSIKALRELAPPEKKEDAKVQTDEEQKTDNTEQNENNAV